MATIIDSFAVLWFTTMSLCLRLCQVPLPNRTPLKLREEYCYLTTYHQTGSIFSLVLYQTALNQTGSNFSLVLYQTALNRTGSSFSLVLYQTALNQTSSKF